MQGCYVDLRSRCVGLAKIFKYQIFFLHLRGKDCDDENLEKISEFGHETMQLSG